MLLVVSKDDIKIEDSSKIHSGELNANDFEFQFSEDYDDLTKKAIFEVGNSKIEANIKNNKCDIPAAVLQEGNKKFVLRVYGYKEENSNITLRLSPTPVTIPLYEGSYVGNVIPAPTEVTPEINLQDKSITIENNGSTTISADDGYDGLNEVSITTNVPQSGGGNIDLTTGIRFAFSTFSEIPSEIVNANWENVVDVSNMFSDCAGITSVPYINTSSITNFYRMFMSCNQLQNVPVLDLSNAQELWDMFGVCAELTEQSLNNIMEMCIGANNYYGIKTLARLGLSQSQAEICKTLSNYSDFVNAGWSTGYELTINVDLETIKTSSTYAIPELNCLEGYLQMSGLILTLNDPNTSETITGIMNWGWFGTDDYDPEATKHLTFSVTENYDSEQGGYVYTMENIAYNED